jgi:hypothetical protein
MTQRRLRRLRLYRFHHPSCTAADVSLFYPGKSFWRICSYRTLSVAQEIIKSYKASLGCHSAAFSPDHMFPIKPCQSSWARNVSLEYIKARETSNTRTARKNLLPTPVRCRSGPRYCNNVEVPYRKCLDQPSPEASYINYEALK